jgi:AcrR family transcriptional regulator
MAVDTKERLVKASTELFQRQGFAGTGIKQILASAHAPFSSLYHHFPGGKDELAVEVILTSGAGYQRLVELVWDDAPDAVESVRAVFDGAAAVLEETDYVEGCPIATVALEVASTNETLRRATAEVFEAWTQAATARLVAARCDPAGARRAALVIIALLEGAFVLCQATQSVEPMKSAGEAAVAVVERELGRKGPR